MSCKCQNRELTPKGIERVKRRERNVGTEREKNVDGEREREREVKENGFAVFSHLIGCSLAYLIFFLKSRETCALYGLAPGDGVTNPFSLHSAETLQRSLQLNETVIQ